MYGIFEKSTMHGPLVTSPASVRPVQWRSAPSLAAVLAAMRTPPTARSCTRE